MPVPPGTGALPQPDFADFPKTYARGLFYCLAAHLPLYRIVFKAGTMEQTTFADKGADARYWTGRILVAVIFGVAIWNLIVSLMSNIVVPWLGALAGPNAGLPASFTKNYDYPDLFVAVLQFCVAGIVAVSINWFLQRPRTQRQPAPAAFVPQTTPAVPPLTQSVPVAQPMVPAPVQPTTAAPVQPSAPPPKPASTPVAPGVFASASNSFVMTGSAAAKPAPAPIPAAPATPVVPPPVKASTPTPAPPPKVEPAKPKKEKPVYYNIVGEPVADDED